MEKQSAKLRLSLSSFLLLSAVAFAGGEPPAQLSQSDLHTPEAVKLWLQQNAAKVDKRIAHDFLEMGKDYMQKGNWSAATKTFGESALFYPAPETLRLHADAELKMLGEIRARKNQFATKQHSDLKYVLAKYQTALAADDVLHSLKVDERDTIETYIQCISDYIKEPKQNSACQPVNAYLTSK